MEQDCYLPWKTRDIPALTKVAKLEAEAENIENLHNGIERVLGDDDNGVWLDNGKSIAYNWDSPQTIQTIRLLNDSDLKWEKKMPSMLPKKDLPQAMPKMMLKNAQVRITKADGSLDVIDIKDNDKRLLNFNIDSMDVVSVALTNTQAWGMDRSHIFSFDVK